MRRSFASLSDETPEGRSIVVLAKEKYNIRGREMAPMGAHFIAFSAQTRLSGVDLDGSTIRKGAVDAVLAFARTGRQRRRWRRCRGALHRVGSRGARTQREVRRDRQVGRHAAGRRRRMAGCSASSI